MEQGKMKLVNGKFVMEGAEAETVKAVKPKTPIIPTKEYSEEVLALRDRVIKGNQKLLDAWRKIREIAHNSEEWSAQMARWHEAQERLHILCVELKAKGYTECLYIVDGVKTKGCLSNPDGFWCQVCPSSFRYWEKELMDLPRKA